MFNFLKNSKKEDNIKVWEDTKWLFSKDGPYKVQIYKSTPIYNLDELKSQIEQYLPQSSQTQDKIEVINDDTISYAKTFLDHGYNPLVLNMANHIHPGGGVANGAIAQEEDLFRRSNYHQTLNKYSLPKDTYPLKEQTVIYSPNVCIIKDKNYQGLDRPFYLSFLACPAIHNPKVEFNNKINPQYPFYQNPEDKELMIRKIEMIYLIGILMGHDSLVLGALGCGAFHNPTEEVAKIFHQMNQRYGKFFKKIGFAILSLDKDTKFDTFKQILN